jgi:hypothetical protein
MRLRPGLHAVVQLHESVRAGHDALSDAHAEHHPAADHYPITVYHHPIPVYDNAAADLQHLSGACGQSDGFRGGALIHAMQALCLRSLGRRTRKRVPPAPQTLMPQKSPSQDGPAKGRTVFP